MNAQDINEEAKSAALQTLENFMTQWNTGDDAKLRTAMNFPFVTFVGGSTVITNNTPEEFSQQFEVMRERENWASTSFNYDTLKIFMTSSEKIHLSIDYSRHNMEGECYFTGNVFYVITKQDEHWGIQMRSPVQGSVREQDRNEILEGARKAVLGYMTAFNTSKSALTADCLNYPHLFMINGQVITAKNPKDRSASLDFEKMRTSQNWYVSTFDSLQPSIVTPNKVHWEVLFSRWHADGTRYWTVPALWVTTKVDDHWGIQLRSLMPPLQDENK